MRAGAKAKPKKAPARPLTWGERVEAGKRAANHRALLALMQEALRGKAAEVVAATTRERSIKAAARAGKYAKSERGTLRVNFDFNFARKEEVAGELAGFCAVARRTPYIVLGPDALSRISPDVTVMMFDHEKAHAERRLAEVAAGKATITEEATADEELEISTNDFLNNFLKLWTIKKVRPGWKEWEVHRYEGLFRYYEQASTKAQNAAFAKIRQFYVANCKGKPCQDWKFGEWLRKVEATASRTTRLFKRMTTGPDHLVLMTVPASGASPCPEQ